MTEVQRGIASGATAVLVLRLTPMPRDVSQVTDGYLCSWHGLAVPLEETVQAVNTLAVEPGTSIHGPFVSEQRLRQHEWGSSAEVLSFLIDTVNNLGSDGIMLGLGYAVSRIRGPKQPPASNDEPLVDLAARLATDAVREVFEEPHRSLSVTGVEDAEDSVGVEVTCSAGRRYRATIRRLEDGTPYVHVRRAEPRGDD